MNLNILIIEDDKSISEMINDYFTDEGYTIDCAYDGKVGIEKFNKGNYNIILLDMMLPKRNGIQVIDEIRKNSLVPIIVISAKDTDFDKSVALDRGADDYLTKPFSFIELISRINAIMRRSSLYSKRNEKKISFKEITIDLENYTVEKNKEILKITAKEFEILKLFLKNPSKVYTKEEIYSLVWKDSYIGDENIVNVHMSRLREKIEDDTKKPIYIKTIWGIGYRRG